ncbi:MAG: phage/plasmid primase, P4 family [Candidatus Cloacimonetes bacterium]|nr:phage/plasmid primase, P4 family [Candidatus Cloacimonadota bacterium]
MKQAMQFMLDGDAVQPQSSPITMSAERDNAAASEDGQPALPSVRDESDASVAELFMSQYGKEHRYVSDGNHWLHWAGQHWAPDSQAQEVHKHLHALRGLLSQQKLSGTAVIDKVNDAIITRLSNNSTKNGIVSYLEHLPELVAYQRQLDAKPDIVAFENCALDTAKRQIIRDPDQLRGLLQTKRMPVWYAEQAACPLWEAFLNTIFCGDDKLIAYVQKAAALSLSGTVREELLFFAHGSGRNGKTTFFNVLAGIFGPYSITVDPAVLTCSKLDRSDRNANIKAQLRGVRFATTNEIAERSMFNDLEVKQLSSRDNIPARPLYQNPFEFTPSHKLWIRSNHKPRFNIDDKGLLRRIVLIPFNHVIPADDVEERYEDTLLKEKSGILNWLIQGWLAYLDEGLKLPPACVSEMEAYVRENDTLATFLEEACEADPNAKVLLKEFTADYNAWARLNGAEELSSTKLSSRLRAKNHLLKNGTGNKMTVYGIKLADGKASDASTRPRQI